MDSFVDCSVFIAVALMWVYIVREFYNLKNKIISWNSYLKIREMRGDYILQKERPRYLDHLPLTNYDCYYQSIMDSDAIHLVQMLYPVRPNNRYGFAEPPLNSEI